MLKQVAQLGCHVEASPADIVQLFLAVTGLGLRLRDHFVFAGSVVFEALPRLLQIFLAVP